MYWLARFATQPAVQFSGRCGDESALALDGHPFVRPALSFLVSIRRRLSEEGGDLLPSFELSVHLRGRGLLLGSLLRASFGHGLSMHDFPGVGTTRRGRAPFDFAQGRLSLVPKAQIVTGFSR
jgi:hypothetical protein